MISVLITRMFEIFLIVCILLPLTPIQSSCVYDLGNGKTLDIRPLGQNNGKPKYDNIPVRNPGPVLFSWNGCFPFSKSGGGDCSDAAACFSRLIKIEQQFDLII